jgi:hypothetical protein
MALTLNLSDLSSRATRLASTSGAGVRRIAALATTDDNDDGVVTSVYNAVTKFGTSLLKNALTLFGSVLTFSFTKLWSTIVSAVRFVLNFNFNVTDTELDAQVKAAEIALAAARGSLAGQSLGFAVCGLIPSATIAVFNQPLALYMLKELGEEAADEISSSLTTLVTLQIQQASRQIFANLFKNYRTLFRGAAIGFAQGLVNIGVITQDSVDKANKERNKPWSIAGALEESIESIEDPALQSYAEELWEEFGESCIEAGFIIANSADSFYAQQRIANESFFGSEHTVEIELSRNPNESET